MSKGGNETTSVSETTPWAPLQGPLQQLIRRATGLSNQPPEFFPGQTYVGALPTEEQAFQQRLGFADQMFGEGSPYALALGANEQLLGGGPTSDLYGAVGPQALQAIQGGFTPQNLISGDYRPTYTPEGVSLGYTAPNVDPTVTADPNAAINRMLSGTPDYSGVEAATRAYADPILDILNEDIMPGLASRGVMMNNTTGTTKEANRIIPRVMRDITNQGARLAEQERLRALGAQERGAQLATQAGLSQTGLGLDASRLGLAGAQTQAGLDQQTQALLADLGIAAPQMQLQADIARQGAADRFRDSSLGLLGAAGGLAGQSEANVAQGIANLPGLTQLGLTPSSLLGEYGQFQRGLAEADLQGQMARHDFEQQTPFNMVDWLRGTLTGIGSGFGTTTQTQETESNPLMDALGLATTIGSLIPGPWTPFAMAGNAASNALQPIPMYSLPRRIG